MSSENALESPASPPARTKSRLIRMLTTKRSPDAPHVPKRPVANSAYSKEQREAALRARGLLPPLSLSQQERELDSTIPVLKLEAPIEEEGKVSAADLIKKEWESKNKEREEEQLERLGAFKFGGVPGKTSTLQPIEPSEGSGSLASGTDEPISKTTKAARRQGLHKASLSQSMQVEAEALKNLEHQRAPSDKALPVAPEAKDAEPVTPILDLPPEFQLYAGTLPSPVPSVKDIPAQSSVPTSSSTASADTTTTGQPSPPTEHATPTALKSGVSPSDSLIHEDHAGDGSLPRADSGSSAQTPSLDSSSTVKSSESHSEAKSPKSQIKAVDSGNPIIMESTSDSRAEAQAVERVSFEEPQKLKTSSSSNGHVSEHDDARPPPVPPRDSEKGRKRGITDPPLPKTPPADLPEAVNAAPVRRKTINPFKRNQQPADDPNKPKRNMFSRVGTVLRPKDKYTAPPPLGPTSPRANYSAVSPPQSPTKPAVVRQAVNPVYYSGGDIHAQASTIKDDEERRMAELAFLS